MIIWNLISLSVWSLRDIKASNKLIPDIATIEEIIWVSEILTSFPFTLSPEDVSLDYGTEYQVIGQAFQNGEPIGELGGMFKFTTGEKPGSNEQPEITISFWWRLWINTE